MQFSFPELPFTDPVLIFAMVMVLILLAPIVARRLRLPDIVGLILAGMIFGDHGLGMLMRDDTMQLLGKVGLLFLMFLAGLEIDLHKVKRQRSHSIIFGALTFIFPLTLGTFLGRQILGMNLATSLLMASMFASHTLLTFPILGRLGLTKSRAATTTIGGTIITDTMALLVLAIVSASVAGSLDAQFWVMLALKIFVYMSAVIILVPHIGRWFLRRFSGTENIDFIAVLAIAFSTSYFAHLAGLEPIIGAFMAGLTLNSLIPEKGALMGKINFVGNSLFIPFFLLSVGMLVNIELLWESLEVWKVIGVMIPVALIAKWMAAHLFGKFMRYSGDETGLIYGLSVNQAAATLAAALVGYDIGLFSDSIVTGTIAMIGTTCFLGPVITEKFGRRLVATKQQHISDTSAPLARVMMPVHSKVNVKEALDLAFFLRTENSNEPLYPVNVVYEGPEAEENIAHSEKLLAHLVVRSLSVDVPITPLVVVETNIATGILRAARENRISVISMMWQGELHSRTKTFGPTIDRVIEGSNQSVLVSRLNRPLATSERILLACPPMSNFLPGFDEAISMIKTMAKQSGARLYVKTEKNTIASFKKTIDQKKPAVSMEYQPYLHWKRIADETEQEVQDNDWLIVLEARMGEIAWQPNCDRIPQELVQKIPDNNISFLYPPEWKREKAQSSEQMLEKGVLGQILRSDHCLFQVTASDIRTILEQLLKANFESRGHSAEPIIDSLTAIAQSEPVELVTNVVLLHDHCNAVNDSEIFLVTSTTHMDIPNVEEPPQITLILLDPPDQSPEKHLAALGNIAKLIKQPKFVEQARKARSYADLAVYYENPTGNSDEKKD